MKTIFIVIDKRIYTAKGTVKVSMQKSLTNSNVMLQCLVLVCFIINL